MLGQAYIATHLDRTNADTLSLSLIHLGIKYKIIILSVLLNDISINMDLLPCESW